MGGHAVDQRFNKKNMSAKPDHRIHMKRTGVTRLWWALRHSLAGLRAGCEEPAFRFELALASIMLPASLWVGRDWVEVSLLAGTVLLVMLVELLNTAIEAAVDLNTEEWNALAKRAKDTGSAAVFLSMLWCGGTWLGAMAHKWSWW
jgi:diacylglycerol kinase (ATP)